VRVPGRPLARHETVAVATVGLLGLAALGVVVLVRVVSGVSVGEFTRDPASSQGFPAYVGAISYLGVLAWTAGATAALVGSYAAAPGAPARRFLLAAGVLTAVLALDDLFLLHEQLGTLVAEGGRGSDLVLVIYAVAGMALLWRWRGFVLAETPVALVVPVAVLFLTGTLVDALDAGGPAQYLLEDGPKFLGLLGWGTYLAVVALQEVGRARDDGAQAAPARETVRSS
jgi:hypothetical protein